MPAPIKHGVRAFLSNGQLPDGCDHIAKALRRLTRELEGAVRLSRKDFTVADAAFIQTARRHEGQYRLLEHWLRKHDEQGIILTLPERLAVMKEMRASAKDRDACIKALDLQTAIDPLDLDAMYGHTTEADE